MSIVAQAKIELKAINFGEEDSAAMIDIMERFFNQWDSGGAVSVAAPVLLRLIACKPLAPLTGADDEWFDPMGDGLMLQNVRCGSVFKDPATGVAHDIDAADPEAPITFPYSSDQAE